MRSPGFTLGQLGTVALLAVLTAITVKAQTPPKQPPPPAQNGVGEVTVKGCMQRGADRTTLTDATGTTYLLSHVSRSSRGSAFVEVHGKQVAPAGWHGEAALPGLRVNRMRRLSATCPEKIIPPPSNNSNLSPPYGQSPGTPAYQSPIAPDGQEAAPVLNSQGAGGAPSPGTGNPPQQQTDQQPDKKK